MSFWATKSSREPGQHRSYGSKGVNSVAASTILRFTSARRPLQLFLYRAGTVEGEDRMISYDLMIYSARLTTMSWDLFGDFSDNGISLELKGMVWGKEMGKMGGEKV